MLNIWKITFRSFLAALLIVGMMVGSASLAQEGGDNKNAPLSKGNAWLPEKYQLLNINNLWEWAQRNGESCRSPAGDYGCFFPRGKTYMLYANGFIVGARAYLDEAHTQSAPYGQTIRVVGSMYRPGYREGWVNGLGANATPEDIANPATRIYRIRRDWKEMSEDELRRDAAESNEIPMADVTDDQMQKIIDDYATCWDSWPVEHGAPFVDRNGNGVYDPPPADFAVKDLIEQGYDEPGIVGADPNSPADQVLFTIYNDLHAPTTRGLARSEPIGLEIQETKWGYKRTDALGNIYFRKWRFINKGGVEVDESGTMGAFYLDSVYVAQWCDVTDGDYTDDCLGCDTTLSMAFVWNGNAIDRDFRKFGLPPAAGGFDYLQGPIVPSPGDRAVFDLQYIDDYKNLGMSAFSYFSAASPYSDPGGGYETNAIRWYKMMRGYAPIGAAEEDIRYNFPPGVEPGPFPLAGDPVTGTGHIDGMGTDYSIQPGDRRMLPISGPFQMAPGDTNEAVVAFVCGLGGDRFSSISVMKFNDRFAQNTYDALFQVPNPPAAPDVKVAELDGEVILEWGSNLERVADTEEKVNEPGGFSFEGYNVYQLPTATSSITDAKRIATYDLLTDPAVVLDEQFDVVSGQILPTAVQFGSNSGIQRTVVFDRDYLLDVDKLNNGVDYYLAVTAYSVSTVPGFLPQSLESALQVIKVVPKQPFGTVYELALGDTVTATHTAGSSDGTVYSTVIDPTQLTGHTYEVTFSDTSGGQVATRWKLTDTSTGTVLLSDQENFSGDDEYSFVDGLFLKVAGPPLEGKDWDAEGDRWFSGAGEGELLYGGVYLHPTWSGGSSTAPPDYKTVEVRFVSKTGFTDLNGNGTYDIGEPYELPAEGTQKAFMYSGWDNEAYVGFFDVPFTAWDVNDPANPRQLNAIVRDRDENQQWDLHSNVDDPALPNGGDQRYNYVYIAGTDYDPTGALHAPPSQGGTGWMGNDAEQPGLWVLYLTQRGSREPYGADVVLTLVPNFVITTSDVFTFTTPAPVTNDSLNLISAKKVGVFPNPYYAFNPLEVDKLGRFVTFNNLPRRATIHLFAVSGHLVRKLEKDDDSQFARWDLLNESGLPIASGVYIAHIEMPDVGAEKVLKLVIVMEAEILDIF